MYTEDLSIKEIKELVRVWELQVIRTNIENKKLIEKNKELEELLDDETRRKELYYDNLLHYHRTYREVKYAM